jgi:hypothetical protein
MLCERLTSFHRPLRRSRCCARIRSIRSPQDAPPAAGPIQQPLLQLGLQLPRHHRRRPHNRPSRGLQRPLPRLQGDIVARSALLSAAVRILRGTAGPGEALHGVQQHRPAARDCDSSQCRWHGRCHHHPTRRREDAHTNPAQRHVRLNKRTKGHPLPRILRQTLHSISTQQTIALAKSSHIHLLPFNHAKSARRGHARHVIRHDWTQDHIQDRGRGRLV